MDSALARSLCASYPSVPWLLMYLPVPDLHHPAKASLQGHSKPAGANCYSKGWVCRAEGEDGGSQVQRAA